MHNKHSQYGNWICLNNWIVAWKKVIAIITFIDVLKILVIIIIIIRETTLIIILTRNKSIKLRKSIFNMVKHDLLFDYNISKYRLLWNNVFYFIKLESKKLVYIKKQYISCFYYYSSVTV